MHALRANARRAWWAERSLSAGGLELNPLWHCFGVRDEIVDAETAAKMLEISQTALLPLNTHRLAEPQAHGTPPIVVGHGDVTLEELAQLCDVSMLVPCLNINLQTTAEGAVRLARLAREQTGISLLKLEVLTDDLSESDNAALLEAFAELARDGGFTIMPLLSADLGVARSLVDLGAPLLRVMGSPIGSLRGLDDPEAIGAIAELGVPVIVDGGLGAADDFLDALEAGAAGGLINSLLFRDDDPVGAMTDFVDVLSTMRPPRGGPAAAEP